MDRSTLKIAIVGPESSGKSTLAQQLAAHYQTALVPEYARVYLTKNGPKYTYTDVEQIAKGQLALEKEFVQKMGGPHICDTNLLVIKIWMKEVFGQCPKWIEEKVAENGYDLTLLTSPDIPWEHDELRENPNDRNRLFEIYQAELDDLKHKYTIISGSKEERFSLSVSAIAKLQKK